MKILVIVAHPDDEILGVGGTMLKHVKMGDKIRVIYLATGITSRRGKFHQNVSNYQSEEKLDKTMKQQIGNLRKDAKNACKTLKVNDISFYDFPDNEMDSISLLKIIKTIEKEIEKTKPDRIYTHHKNDLNIDHRIVFNATLTACRPINKKTPDVYRFDVPSSTEWNFLNTFSPNYFVNIEKELQKKLDSMNEYKNEIKKFPHPRSLEGIKVSAKKWGTVCGKKAAEAFEVIRIIED